MEVTESFSSKFKLKTHASTREKLLFNITSKLYLLILVRTKSRWSQMLEPSNNKMGNLYEAKAWMLTMHLN